MTCAEFNTAVVDIASRVDVDRDAAEHATQCKACAELLATQQEISHGLKRLAANFRTERPNPTLEQDLLAAFRENASRGGNVILVNATSERRSGYWLRAAAAIFVICGLGAWLLLSSGAPATGGIVAGTGRGVAGPPVGARGQGEFIPVLGYGPVSATDSGTVVRVLLPEDAFQYFAVPVASIPGGQRFPADVLIADDGSVRAIRLVNGAPGRR